MVASVNSFSRFSKNLKKQSYKTENTGNLYFSYVHDYRAALRGGNKDRFEF